MPYLEAIPENLGFQESSFEGAVSVPISFFFLIPIGNLILGTGGFCH